MKPFCGNKHIISALLLKRAKIFYYGFYNIMLNIPPQNYNYKPHFTGGITRKLCRNYYHCEADVVEVFNRHPQKNGIAGGLPINWIKKINPEIKREAVKNIYSQFACLTETAKTNLKQASDMLNTTLQRYKILTPGQSYNIEKIDASGALYTENGYVLSGSNADSLFIKEFADLSQKSQRQYLRMTERNGKFVELARALQINNRIKDRHIMHTYWGDTQKGYMVSEYVKPLKESKSPVEIKEFYDNEKALINDLNKKYGFTFDEIKKYNVKTGYEYKDKFYSYPDDLIIYNYFSNMLEKYGLKHHDLQYNTDNYIVTADNKGNPLLKLIDFGGISKI